MKLATCALLIACSIVAVADEPQTAIKPSAPQPSAASPQVRMIFKSPVDTCYFIRTIKPVQSEPSATGFIKLQARLGPIEHGPDCTNIGGLKPSIPVEGPDAGDAAPGPVLTPVADR